MFRTESEVGDTCGVKDDGGRYTRRFSGNDRGSSITEHDGSWQHTHTKFAAEEQPKFV